MHKFDFTLKEFSILKRLDSPAKIQDFLDKGLEYNLEKEGDTYYSLRLVLRHKKAHCLEGALLAATALRVHGHQPLLVGLRAVRDEDHVLAVYKMKNHWGAIAQSKFAGLGFREAVYSSLRELAVSYFEGYFNRAGEKTLREYSVPVNLKRFDKRHWMTSEESMEYLADYLDKIKHKRITLPEKLRRIPRKRLNAEQFVKRE